MGLMQPTTSLLSLPGEFLSSGTGTKLFYPKLLSLSSLYTFMLSFHSTIQILLSQWSMAALMWGCDGNYGRIYLVFNLLFLGLSQGISIASVAIQRSRGRLLLTPLWQMISMISSMMLPSLRCLRLVRHLPSAT